MLGEIMIVNSIKIELERLLLTADEIWFAVALLKDSAFEFVQENIPKGCIQHFLVGIDLPTPPSVLKALHARQERGVFDCAIYKSSHNFHPKAYLIRVENQYTAIVGSSNATNGGFKNNIELNYKVTNQLDCKNILEWFNALFEKGYPVSHSNISEYERSLESIGELEEEIKKKRQIVDLKRPDRLDGYLDNIDFSDRYFKKEHHWAFRKELWYANENEAIKEREVVRDKCQELHEQIYPQFEEYGIQILKPNPKPEHLISMIRQIDPDWPRPLDAMWLSYGKNPDEIKRYQKLVGNDQKGKQTFIHHARLQIRIDLNIIGIWLLFAKENEGGLFDRSHFKEKMLNKDYRNRFFTMLSNLPDQYFVSVGGQRKMCSDFVSPDDLHDYTRKDSYQEYFIIGKDYDVEADAMSESNLPLEVLKVFKLLLPFYESMRHKLPN
ncbi:phospholipase D-like domain-containing protein [Owenweeksia hongkongensis]|uniref:phospholipase D-like domain-containing protein n=1 Tax=Owenweeksia hongkongensis TaxID=253245 RepID=UPI003A94B3CF